MKILCQIISVQPLGLVVSLPSQLLGHVPITQISPQLSSMFEAIENNDASSDDDGESAVDGAGVPDLSLLFRRGQYVRAVVTGVKPAGLTETTVTGFNRDPVEKASRRVELSLVPEQINANVARVDIQPGFVSGQLARKLSQH